MTNDAKLTYTAHSSMAVPDLPMGANQSRRMALAPARTTPDSTVDHLGKIMSE